MPENVRYGITITPPNGDPVTGTANFEPNINNFIVGGIVNGNLSYCYPASYNIDNPWTVNLDPNSTYEIIVGVTGQSVSYTDADGKHTLSNKGTGGSSSSGYNMLPNYVHAKTNDSGTISFSWTESTSTVNRCAILIFKNSAGLSAYNIKSGVTIGNITGSANNMPNDFGVYMNRQFSSGSSNTNLFAYNSNSGYSYTKNGNTFTSTYDNGSVLLYLNVLQNESQQYPSTVSTTSGNISISESGFRSITGSFNGHTTSFNPPTNGNTQTFTVVYSRPAPGWEDLKPENIRAGVTITPPGGTPVTGQCMPCDISIGQNIIGFMEASGRYTINGEPPDGVGMSVQGTTGFRITGSGTITGYIVSRGGTISFNGDYDGSGISETLAFGYIPPTTLSSGISVSLGTTSLRSVIVCLIKIDNTELTASNIKAGITINGITGTMVGGELTAKLIVTANSGGIQFRTSLGQTSDTNNTDKPVNPLPDNSKLTILASNNGYSNFNATINSSSETINGNSSFDEIVTSMSIAGFTNQNNYTVGAIGLFYK